MEKDKIVRAKEIEAEKNVSIEQIKSAKGSIKDEVLTIKITIIFLAIFGQLHSHGWRKVLRF